MRSRPDGTVYHYSFKRHLSMDDVQDSLTLAVLGAEQLHGRARMRLDASFRLDRQRRSCTVDGTTAVGQDIARLLAGYLGREFGEKSFTVRRAAPVDRAKR